MTSDHDIELVRQAAHGDPFAVLGVHTDTKGQRWLRAMLPHATHVTVLDAHGGDQLGVLQLRHGDGFFEGVLTGELNSAETPNYRLQVRWQDGNSSFTDDPYRFPPVLGELDVWLLSEGSHLPRDGSDRQRWSLKPSPRLQP